MRYLLLASFKGDFPQRLHGFARDARIDAVVSLGDFYTPECAVAANALLTAYPSVEAPGYRDVAYGQLIAELERHVDADQTTPLDGKYSEAVKFMKEPKALAALRGPLERTRADSFVRYVSLDKRNLGDVYRTALSYSPLACTEDSKVAPKDGLPQHFRCRLLDRKDYNENFKRMYELGLRIMIVSEGSEQRYVALCDKDLIGANELAQKDVVHKLKRGSLHLINPGDVVSGHVAVINTEIAEEGVIVPQLTFHVI